MHCRFRKRSGEGLKVCVLGRVVAVGRLRSFAELRTNDMAPTERTDFNMETRRFTGVETMNGVAGVANFLGETQTDPGMRLEELRE